MAFEVTMPQMGADMTEGTVVQWFKKVGDSVERGEILAEIETDKANVELEAFEAGTLLKLVAQEGDLVPVGDVIALLGEEGEDTGDDDTSSEDQSEDKGEAKAGPKDGPKGEEGQEGDEDEGESEEESAPPPKTRRGTGQPRTREEAPGAARATQTEDTPRERDDGTRIKISPVARRIATDNDLDISGLTGSGPDGRILRRDVEEAMERGEEREAPAAAVRQAPASAEGRTESLPRIRQTIARRMLQSKQEQPHYYLTVDVDMTDAMAFRSQLNSALPEDERATVNDLVIKACAVALQRHPKFTARFTEDGLEYAGGGLNIDIGVALDEGLIAPSLLDCDTKTVAAIAKDAKAMIERARAGKLRADEYGRGVFTITNLGAYGVEALIGIINPPQAAILGVGSAMPKPVAIDGEVVIRPMMKLALSADHRVSDGAEGARFIKEIQGILEAPAQLSL